MSIVIRGFGKDSSEVLGGLGGARSSAGTVSVIYGDAPSDHLIVIFAENRFIDVEYEDRNIPVFVENRFIDIEQENREIPIYSEDRTEDI